MQTMIFVGKLAGAPSLTRGNVTRCNFTLIENRRGAKDEVTGKRKEYTTALPFVAFGPLAEFVADNFRKGCQMIAKFDIRNNNYEGDNGTVYNYDFVLDHAEFGAPGPAKRAEFASQGEPASSEDEKF